MNRHEGLLESANLHEPILKRLVKKGTKRESRLSFWGYKDFIDGPAKV